MKKVLSVFIAVCLVLSLFAGIFMSVPSAKAANLGVWTQISLKMLVYPDIEAQVHCFAIDPITPSILYADTGEGIFHSTNSGATWKQVSAGLPTFGVLCLAIDPKTPATLYVGTLMDGVFRSTNSGSTWTAVNAGFTVTSAPHIAVDPVNTSTVYIGTNGYGIFRSTDGGNSWHPANTGLPDDYPQEIKSIAVDPSTPATLYVTNSIGRLFRSVDSGDHWVAVSNGSHWINVLAIDPAASTKLYAGTTNGVLLSIDSGVTWAAMNTGFPDQTSILSLAIDPRTSTTLYASTSGRSVFSSTDGGKTWTSINTYLKGCPETYDSITSLVLSDTKSGIALYGVTEASSGLYRYIPASAMSKKTTVAVLRIGISTFTVDGVKKALDSPPVIKNGRTLVPIRAIIEALGGTVGWDKTARKATVSLGETTISLWIGKNGATVNGKSTPIDSTNARVVPEIISDTTMLPLRFVTENLGATVSWEQGTQTITITYTR
jgi:photosystem II stability/assembly factor-like uncharacterized protein